MATYETKGRLTYKDENSDNHIIYPVTKVDCIEDMPDIKKEVAESVAEYLDENPVETPDLTEQVGRAEAAAGEAEKAASDALNHKTTASYAATAATNAMDKALEFAIRAEEAAANVGNGSGGMFVTLDETTKTSSHSASEIREHFSAGGIIHAFCGNTELALYDVTETIVCFAASGTIYQVTENKSYSTVIVGVPVPYIGSNGNWWLDGEDTGKPSQGDDYVLTQDDKAEIAEMAAGLVEVPDSGGNADQSAVCMTGEGAPTEQTEAEVGALYMDTLTGDVYKCTDSVNEAGNITINTDVGTHNIYVKADGRVENVPESSVLYNKYSASEFVDVSILKGKTVTVVCTVADLMGFSFYDADQIHIVGVNGRNGYVESSDYNNLTSVEFVVPENAAFIRYTVRTDKHAMSDAKVVYEGELYVYTWQAISAKVGENEGDAFSATRGIALEEKSNEPMFILPAKSIAVVGHEWNMYFHNITDYLTDKYFIRCSISPSITGAKMLNDCLRLMPTADDIGIHKLSLRLYSKTGNADMWKLTKEQNVSINVIADSVIADKKVIFIGDSLTQNGTYPAEVQYNLSSGGITSLGKRSTTVNIGENSYTVNHEGRAGWASYDYTRTRDGYRDGDNPFWNDDAGAFDFSYYMQTQGYSGVDVVCIGLGTNGVDKYADDCEAIDTMIASIHAYNPNIKILISLIALPATQDGCGTGNGLNNSELLKMQVLRLNREYMKRYQNTMNNVDVAELYFALDTKNDYPLVEEPISARNPKVVSRQTNNVHPSTYGYLKFADVWYNNILYHLTNGE